jgi:UDPglucose 6-dehydrogenase
MTEWDEFKDYDWQKIYDNMLKPAFVFDGRNLLDAKKIKEIGFVFQSIGS